MNRPTYAKKPALKSIDGIWVRPRKNVIDQTSTTMMDTFKSYFDNDVVLTAIVVVPASFAWIVTEKVWLGLAVAAVMYLAYEYGIPALRTGSLNVQPFIRLYTTVGDLIRSRSVKSI